MSRTLIIVLLAAITSTSAWADGTATQSVTVDVDVVNELEATGTVLLTIASATAGSDLNAEVDSTTADLLWTTNDVSRKITVASDLTTPMFHLSVLAEDVSGGTAAAEVEFADATAQDLVTGVATNVGGCGLKYSAVASAADGVGTDSHTLTFTIASSL